jgi:hypothetical protein
VDEQRLLMFARIYRVAFDRWCARATAWGEDDPLALDYQHAATHAGEAMDSVALGMNEAYPFTTLAELDRWRVLDWPEEAPDAPPDQIH